MSHSVTWQTAQPLWDRSLGAPGAGHPRFRAPALLRFKGDDFMAQLQRALGAARDFAALVLRAETWRAEQAGWLDAPPASADAAPKLYQPAHFRFYLVSASLVCQQPGLPDRRIEAARGESASFVLRRLFPRGQGPVDPADATTYQEYGWSGTAQDGAWRPIPRPQELGPEEERIPLFPARFEAEGRPRRLLAGLVPVARRDVYEAGAGRASAPASARDTLGDPFSTEGDAVALEQIFPALDAFGSPRAVFPQSSSDAERLTEKTAVAHALLLLVDFLQQRCKPVWDAIGAGSDAQLAGAGPRALYQRLAGTAAGRSVTYAAILQAVDGLRTALAEDDPDEATLDGAFGGAPLPLGTLRTMVHGLSLTDLGDLLRGALPDPRPGAFQASVGAALAAAAAAGLADDAAQDALLAALLALADFLRAELPELWTAIAGGDPAALSTADRAVHDLLAGARLGASDWRALLADADANRLDVQGGRITPAVKVVALRLSAPAIAASTAAVSAPLADTVGAALAAQPLGAGAQAGGAAAAAGAAASSASPPAAPADALYVIRCAYERPRCKGFADAVVSEPSAPFRLASFFDADAPVRPTRILMPDVSLKALRRAPRGVQIALSKELRAQIERVRGISLDDLGKGNLKDSGGLDVGLVCSLSIPIITIVALMLLIVIVSLLNIVFWWLPFFILCLPRIGRRS